jgi:hypothetical protein
MFSLLEVLFKRSKALRISTIQTLVTFASFVVIP